jgi:hypothetical protein
MVSDSSRPLIPSLPRQQTPPSQAGPGGKMKKSVCIISGILTIILVSSPVSYACNTDSAFKTSPQAVIRPDGSS